MLSNDSRVQNWVHGVCEMLILWVQIQQDLDNSGANSGKDGSLGPRSQPSQGWFWSQELALEFSPRSCNSLGRSHLLCGSGSHSWMTWSFSSYNNFVNTLVPVLIFKISFIKFFSAKNILFSVSLVAQMVKNLPAMRDIWVWSLDWEDPLEEGTATHSSILAWRIPWT